MLTLKLGLGDARPQHSVTRVKDIGEVPHQYFPMPVHYSSRFVNLAHLSDIEKDF